MAVKASEATPLAGRQAERRREAQALRESAAQFVNRWSTDKPEAPSRDGREPDGEAEDKQSTEKLIRRLAALDHALNTLPQQAKRLARIMAQREHAPAGASSSPAAGNPLRGSLPSHPIRPGIPPGSNKSSNEPSHEVLRELHGLMRDWEKDAWERRCEANAEP